jgi:hypothetical protein
MTAQENSFCCATDMAPMSEPGAYGAGTIGTVSNRTFKPFKQTDYDHQHTYEIRVRSIEHAAALD